MGKRKGDGGLVDEMIKKMEFMGGEFRGGVNERVKVIGERGGEGNKVLGEYVGFGSEGGGRDVNDEVKGGWGGGRMEMKGEVKGEEEVGKGM